MAAAAAAAAVEMAHHVVAVNDDDDKFAEDECTMDFGDEEDAKLQSSSFDNGIDINGRMTLQQRHLLACQPVPGAEDFSRYLPDDEDVDRHHPLQSVDHDIQLTSLPLIVDPTSTTRRYRKRNEQTSTSPLSSPATSPAVRSQSTSPPPVLIRRGASNSVDSGERGQGSSLNTTPALTSPTMSAARLSSSTNGASLGGGNKPISTIRDRLGRFLTRKSKSRRSRQSEESSTTATMHDFSFADSKMASEFLHGGARSPSPNNSPSQLETQSDLGFTGQPGWWDIGTLRSSRSGYSSNSSAADSTLSKRNSKISSGQDSVVGKSLRGFFQRNHKSQSVPNLQAAVNDNYDSSSTLSATSGSGSGGGGKSTMSVTNRSTNAPSAGQPSTTSSSMPPPLPPLRRPGRPRENGEIDDRDERSHSRSRVADLLKKLRPGTPSESSRTTTMTTTGQASRATAERARSAPRNQPASISVLRYHQTRDEIPVTF